MRAAVCMGRPGRDVDRSLLASDLARVDRWDDASAERIRLCDKPGFFIDPLGALAILDERDPL